MSLETGTRRNGLGHTWLVATFHLVSAAELLEMLASAGGELIPCSRSLSGSRKYMGVGQNSR
jgi:hypothetical protein